MHLAYHRLYAIAYENNKINFYTSVLHSDGISINREKTCIDSIKNMINRQIGLYAAIH